MGDNRGVLLCHLQACCELLQLSQRKRIAIDPGVLAFVLESYLYSSAVGTTFVYDDRPAKLTFDSEYDSLQSLCCDTKGYGFMLGYASKLFQLLPRLGQAVGRWISEDCDDLVSSSADEPNSGAGCHRTTKISTELNLRRALLMDQRPSLS